MACRGVHFALSSEEQLKMAELTKSQGNVVEYIQEEIEDRWDREWLCATDKAWDAIHRCLTDGLCFRLTIQPLCIGVCLAVYRCKTKMIISFPLLIKRR